MNFKSKKSNHGFTLIEILTVTTIIAIVAGLLLSGISKGRAYAVKTSCIMQLSKIELMLRMYAADYRDTFPNLYNRVPDWTTGAPSNSLISALSDYGGREGNLQCPSPYSDDAQHSYYWYEFDNGFRNEVSPPESRYTSPERLAANEPSLFDVTEMEIFQCRDNYRYDGEDFTGGPLAPQAIPIDFHPHLGGRMVLFGDGHVDTVR